MSPPQQLSTGARLVPASLALVPLDCQCSSAQQSLGSLGGRNVSGGVGGGRQEAFQDRGMEERGHARIGSRAVPVELIP